MPSADVDRRATHRRANGAYSGPSLPARGSAPEPAHGLLTIAGERNALAAGKPSIRIRDYLLDEGLLHVDAIDLTEDELALVCSRLEEVLRAPAAEKKALMEKFGGEGSGGRPDWFGD